MISARRSRTRLWVALLGVLVVVLAACGGSSSSSDDGPPEQEAGDCPVDALENADGPVEIVFWNSATAEIKETLERLVQRYNSSQDEVVVTMEFQGSYDETYTKYVNFLRGGSDLPTLVQVEETAVQGMIDSQSIVPAEDCIAADDSYDPDLVAERVVDAFSYADRQQAVAWNVSNPVLFYNELQFEKAQLDPKDPPTTLDEVRAVAEQLKSTGAATGAPLTLQVDAWFLEQMMAKDDQVLVNEENGRQGRATKSFIDSDAGMAVYEWMDQMEQDGLLVVLPEGADDQETFFKIAAQESAMTIDTSAAIRTVLETLKSPGFEAVNAVVRLGVSPMPGLQEEDSGGTMVGGGAWFMSNKSSPEEQAAAWEFAKWFLQPEQQAEFHAGTGYLPTNSDAEDQPLVTQLWVETPQFRVAYDQLFSGNSTAASAGPLIGNYKGVRDAINGSLEDMFFGSATAEEANATAQSEADAAIADYRP